MQRHTDEGVVLACDFCGTDWDQVAPMIEGHRGSILCLTCLGRAIDEATEPAEPFTCTLCTQQRQAEMKMYRNPAPPTEANEQAALCWDCAQQADRAFAKDPDTEWQRRIDPSDRWR